jgi:DNA (cytosine-5)-methyltransferase 1
MTKIYINEIDDFACHWLEQLMKDEIIPNAHIDNRSIKDVKSNELQGYDQCHFFGGIGVWLYALRQSDWADDRPVWTGSCPCQPFSQASQTRLGAKDERHLWPEFYRLIRECQPPTVLGEQVCTGHGKHWLDGLYTDLEKSDYSVGSIILGAHSAKSPHQRQRVYWVGERNVCDSSVRGRNRGAETSEDQQERKSGQVFQADRSGVRDLSSGSSQVDSTDVSGSTGEGQLRNANDKGLRDGRQFLERGESSTQERQAMPDSTSGSVGVARGGVSNSNDEGLQGQERCGKHDTEITAGQEGTHGSTGEFCPCKHGNDQDDQANEEWDTDWILLRDKKWYPIKPLLEPLADGVTNRVPVLKAIGNAIQAETAKIFITSYMGSVTDRKREAHGE